MHTPVKLLVRQSRQQPLEMQTARPQNSPSHLALFSRVINFQTNDITFLGLRPMTGKGRAGTDSRSPREGNFDAIGTSCSHEKRLASRWVSTRSRNVSDRKPRDSSRRRFPGLVDRDQNWLRRRPSRAEAVVGISRLLPGVSASILNVCPTATPLVDGRPNGAGSQDQTCDPADRRPPSSPLQKHWPKSSGVLKAAPLGKHIQILVCSLH